MILNSTSVDCSPTMTTTTSTTTNKATITACQPPAGYTLETTVDKFYKPVKDKVTWQTARAACSSEGSMLIELRTAMEYQVIRPIFGITFISFMISIVLSLPNLSWFPT